MASTKAPLWLFDVATNDGSRTRCVYKNNLKAGSKPRLMLENDGGIPRCYVRTASMRARLSGFLRRWLPFFRRRPQRLPQFKLEDIKVKLLTRNQPRDWKTYGPSEIKISLLETGGKDFLFMNAEAGELNRDFMAVSEETNLGYPRFGHKFVLPV